jgi:hypothetical protein
MPLNGSVFLLEFDEMLNPDSALTDAARAFLFDEWFEGRHFVVPTPMTIPRLRRAVAESDRFEEALQTARGALNPEMGNRGPLLATGTPFRNLLHQDDGVMSNALLSILLGLAVLSTAFSPGFNGRWLRRRIDEAMSISAAQETASLEVSDFEQADEVS